MSVFSYVATRGIVEVGISLTGSDIFIAALDGSINSTATDLTGLLANDWILVSGSAVDDGWHQVSVDSVTGKILTLSILTDETAGSIITITGYKHGINQQYSLETASQALTKNKIARTKKSTSLSGVVETLYFNEIAFWEIKTGLIREAELQYWEELFSSVRAGELFIFDPYGSVASPNKLNNCILDGNYKVSRKSPIGIYDISFKVRIA